MGFADLLKTLVDGFVKSAEKCQDRQEKAFDRYMEKLERRGYNKDDD